MLTRSRFKFQMMIHKKFPRAGGGRQKPLYKRR